MYIPYVSFLQFLPCNLTFNLICTQISETDKRIDIERLKTREKIMFFEEMMLFEDELADNGCAQLTVKIVS